MLDKKYDQGFSLAGILELAIQKGIYRGTAAAAFPIGGDFWTQVVHEALPSTHYYIKV